MLSNPGPRTLLIDLDGTLTDPKPGITNCIRYALEQLGRPVPAVDDLTWCIGPPLMDSFRVLLPDADEDVAVRALGLYRERFKDTGMYENVVYDGTAEFLGAVRGQGRRLYLATSKPHVYANPILEYFGLDGYFDGVYGSELDGTRADKRELLAHLLAEQGLAGNDCVMIGDRIQDANAARHVGALSVWADWGYGETAERDEAAPDFVCAAMPQLSELIAEVA
ncbi:MAG: HAD hydrolase-like protein [Rhodospirillaceae bacterium]|jgi:phosphoglycolate phosphatase|nr:HAD hydrolase-like protein [Rhodospirillaceae bacterium]MBT6289637.1 HAD hydrolase-like protein [Rhodospirillaceae bacterium]MBT7570110.1 HAD hydrolase-like protein [Rhodospirillaceae bacterium]